MAKCIVLIFFNSLRAIVTKIFIKYHAFLMIFPSSSLFAHRDKYILAGLSNNIMLSPLMLLTPLQNHDGRKIG